MICIFNVKFPYLSQNVFTIIRFDIPKNIFTCLFSVHKTISLSRHEQVCLMRLRFERYFSHHRAKYMIMSRIFKENIWTSTETIKLTDKKKLHNLTNYGN